MKKKVVDDDRGRQRKTMSYSTIVIPEPDPSKAKAVGPDGAKENALKIA